ncbi:hypothetical protein PR048_020869 [Dryococelus australis]|uniref:Uncharacterized protein n=1 Tax=Dryococelus australis TaxID=614101 RepID=A0ABQ9GWM3_9NEOP|nr:hypothetical protein PR048_020869 [Dryococelus australis]
MNTCSKAASTPFKQLVKALTLDTSEAEKVLKELELAAHSIHETAHTSSSNIQITNLEYSFNTCLGMHTITQLRHIKELQSDNIYEYIYACTQDLTNTHTGHIEFHNMSDTQPLHIVVSQLKKIPIFSGQNDENIAHFLDQFQAASEINGLDVTEKYNQAIGQTLHNPGNEMLRSEIAKLKQEIASFNSLSKKCQEEVQQMSGPADSPIDEQERTKYACRTLFNKVNKDKWYAEIPWYNAKSNSIVTCTVNKSQDRPKVQDRHDEECHRSRVHFSPPHEQPTKLTRSCTSTQQKHDMAPGRERKCASPGVYTAQVVGTDKVSRSEMSQAVQFIGPCQALMTCALCLYPRHKVLHCDLFPNQEIEFQTNIENRFHSLINKFCIGHTKFHISKDDTADCTTCSIDTQRSAMMKQLWLKR